VNTRKNLCTQGTRWHCCS